MPVKGPRNGPSESKAGTRAYIAEPLGGQKPYPDIDGLLVDAASPVQRVP